MKLINVCALALCLDFGTASNPARKDASIIINPNTPRYCGWNDEIGDNFGWTGTEDAFNVTYTTLFATNTIDGAFLDIESGVFVVTPKEIGGYWRNWDIHYSYEAFAYGAPHVSETYLVKRINSGANSGHEELLDRIVHIEQSGVVTRYITSFTEPQETASFYLKTNMLSGHLKNVMICFISEEK